MICPSCTPAPAQPQEAGSQRDALAIVSDPGTLPEESSFYLSIGHPIAAVCIRTSTERPEALEAGDFILAGISTNELLQATDMAIRMKREGVLGKPCPDYVDETVSMKVVRMLMTANQLEHERTYRFPGEMSESGKYMRFNISKKEA